MLYAPFVLMLLDSLLMCVLTLELVTRSEHKALVTVGLLQCMLLFVQLLATFLLVHIYIFGQRGRFMRMQCAPASFRWEWAISRNSAFPSAASLSEGLASISPMLSRAGSLRGFGGASDAPPAARWNTHPGDHENWDGWRIIGLGMLLGPLGTGWWDLLLLMRAARVQPRAWAAYHELDAFLSAYRPVRVQLCALAQSLPNCAMLCAVLWVQYGPKLSAVLPWLFHPGAVGAFEHAGEDAEELNPLPHELILLSAAASALSVLRALPLWLLALRSPRRWLIAGRVPLAELGLDGVPEVRLAFEPSAHELDELCLALSRSSRVRTFYLLRVRLRGSSPSPQSLHTASARIYGALVGSDREATSVDATGRNLSDQGAIAIAEGIGRSRVVAAAKLAHNALTDAAAVAIAEAVASSLTLAELDLSGNSFGRSMAEALARALRLRRPDGLQSALLHLNLAHNNLGGAGAELLSSALDSRGRAGLPLTTAVTPQLRTLHLGQNEIRDRGALALGTALGVNSSLLELRLPENEIGSEGAHALAEALRVNGRLQMLSLYGNQLGEAGALSLAFALEGNSSLTDLRLGFNHLGDAGCVAIATALRHNGTLRSISLRQNSLTDRAALALASGLVENHALVTLDLLYNAISDRGAKGIAAILGAPNRSLAQLDLGFNFLSTKGKRALRSRWEESGRRRADLTMY